ncbi:D-glycero-beta-D-manno-heptose 1,7-bisphosphate 7-phosphatase [candidate division KSB1 bacterium]|nr:D-glycero-beta-D-manno-heptose 1,7-bisphosphate 7-phosphatase [candidate division KSB1 bacterium]
MLNRCVFLDRDGTINEEVNYLSRPDQLRLIAGAAEAIKRLNQAGLKVVIITNQAGIARGYFSEAALQQIHLELIKMLRAQDAHIDAIYYCPHHPTAGIGVYKKDCNCRKPKPGLLEKAARELNLDLHQSFIAGDKPADLQAGEAVGCRTILVRTGYGLESEKGLAGGEFQPNHIADDLFEASRRILQALDRS